MNKRARKGKNIVKKERKRSISNMSEDEINRDLYEQVINQIVVHPDKILELHLSFLTAPLFVKYETQGKGHTYTAILELVNYDLYVRFNILCRWHCISDFH